MLRRAQVDHLLRAAAAICNTKRLVMVGTGAVIATARRVPAAMMMTEEVDLYVEGDDDAADQIAASIGEGSQFHRHFGYYGDGVGPATAVLPAGWRSRATLYAVPGHDVEALCPSADDIAVAKFCAFREKDVAWLREALQNGIAKAGTMRSLMAEGLPPQAPGPDEIARRWAVLLADAGGRGAPR